MYEYNTSENCQFYDRCKISGKYCTKSDTAFAHRAILIGVWITVENTQIINMSNSTYFVCNQPHDFD